VPGFVFTHHQLLTALSTAGIVPHTRSPFAALRQFDRAAAPGDPELDELVRIGFVFPAAGAWRLNVAFDALLRAGAAPDEVIDVGSQNLGLPDLTVVRAGSIVFECTALAGDRIRIFFPMARSTIFSQITRAFPGPRVLAAPRRFRVVGDGEQLFTLVALGRRWQGDARPCPTDGLPRLVDIAADDDAFRAPFDVVFGADVIGRLRGNPARARAAVDGLIGAGALSNRDGVVDMTRPVAVPGTNDPGVVIRRRATAERSGDAMLAGLSGDRLVYLRSTGEAGGAKYELGDADEPGFRSLLTSHLVSDDELRDLTSHADLPRPAPSPWRPSHRIPEGGLSAWTSPDLSQAPTAEVDAGLEIEHLETQGAWAYVSFSNGWRAWVDGRRLTPISRVRTIPPGGLPAWSAPDASQRPVAEAQAGLEVRILETTGDWAHVEFTNGWTAWLNGSRLMAGAAAARKRPLPARAVSHISRRIVRSSSSRGV
jgi:hypothetical protein